jgi:hypothetical protein
VGYTPRVPRAPWLLSCLAAAGCTAVDGRAVDVGALELDVAVVVVTDEDGTPLRLTAPFSAGAAPFGRLPSLRLDDGERAFVVGTTRAALLRDDPSLARAPLELATITLGAPPIAPALRVEARQLHVRLGLPEDTVVVDVDLSPGPPALVAALVLDLIVPGDGDDGLSLQPFGAEAALIGAGQILPGETFAGVYRLRRAVALDDDRVLVSSERFLAVVRRGGPLVAEPDPTRGAPYLHASALEAGDVRIADFAVYESDVWIVGERRVPGGSVGRVWRAALDAQGLRPLGTATVTPSTAWPTLPPLRAVAVDARGTVVIGGDEAVLLARGPDAPHLHGAAAARARADRAGHPRRWLAQRDHPRGGHRRRRRAARAGPGGILRAPGQRRARRVDAGRGGRRVRAVARGAPHHGPGGRRRHRRGLGHHPRRRHRPPRRALRRVGRRAPRGPARARTCAIPKPDGGLRLGRLNDILLTPTHALVVIDECTAVLRLRRDDLATSAVSRTGEAARRDTMLDLWGLASTPRGPVAVGGRGLVVEVR